MKKYTKPAFSYVYDSGGLKGDEIAGLNDAELAVYLKKSGYAANKKQYQISEDYILRKIGGDHAIIPVGTDSVISNAVMTPNDTAVFVWNSFLSPSTEEDVVQKCVREYEGPEEEIRKDVHRFVTESLKFQILEEVKKDEREMEDTECSGGGV